MQSCPLRCVSSGSAFEPAECDISLETLSRWVRVNVTFENGTECRCMLGYHIRFCSKNGDDFNVSLTELASIIGFTYTPHLIFVCDSDIRSMHLWEPSPCWESPSSLESSLLDAAMRCQPHSCLCVRHISDFMGYGLFADALLPAGCLICEYTGVVRNRPSLSAYAVRQLPHDFTITPSCRTVASHCNRFCCRRLCILGLLVQILARSMHSNMAALPD